MRKITVAVALVVAISSCGGGEAPRPESRPVGAAPPFELPRTARAVPAFIVAQGGAFTEEEVDRLENIPRLAAVATVGLGEVVVEGSGGTSSVTVGSVDPLEFRSVAPPSTRQADFVWSEMMTGEAIATFATADRLDLGEPPLLRTMSGRLRVGAYADNGIPNIADVLVDVSVGDELGLDPARVAIIGAAPGANLERLRRDIVAAVPEASMAGLFGEPPELVQPPEPELTGGAGNLIGTMTFKVLPNGFIKPDPEWVDANIATSDVPIIGEVACHRLMLPQLSRALGEVERRGLAALIRPDDYGGCYVPRFIDRDPSMPLSMHAFGLAIDFNVSTNVLGTTGDMDARIVEIFKRWGFAWGGEWDRPDPMHFELARLIET
jgi:hypothetical protein